MGAVFLLERMIKAPQKTQGGLIENITSNMHCLCCRAEATTLNQT